MKIFVFMMAGFLFPATAFCNPQQEANELVDLLSKQLAFRQQVEQQSFEITKNLCDVFELRKKYGMSLRPDPASEIWTRMAYFSTQDTIAYRESLYEWFKIGNAGVLTNWGLDEDPSEQDQNILLFNKSRFTKTLVVTKGFFEASQTCGELSSSDLRKFLFEQELAQTAVSFVLLPGLIIKGTVKLGKVSWPLLRQTFIGSVAARMPWSKIAKISAGALFGYVLYTAYTDYFTYEKIQSEGDHTDQKTLDLIKERNVQSALKQWLTHAKDRNEKFVAAESYLLERKDYVEMLYKKYEAELNQVGDKKISAIVDKHVEGMELLSEEIDIYMKAVFYSAMKIFLSK